mgnify:CR=1 FL=1|tara:strand:- start:186 stop:554 length:369 start_codon:yes stop_codon:yes gene_type:complete
MFARFSLMLIAMALVFGGVHAGPGLVEHHHDHDGASLAFDHHEVSNISSVQQDIAFNSQPTDENNTVDVEGDTHQHFSPTADHLSGTKVESTNHDGRSLVFASAPAFMRSVTQKPPIEPPLA